MISTEYICVLRLKSIRNLILQICGMINMVTVDCTGNSLLLNLLSVQHLMRSLMRMESMLLLISMFSVSSCAHIQTLKIVLNV